MDKTAAEPKGKPTLGTARLNGKVALISGGASGIGAETARKMIVEGAKVAIGDIQTEKGEAVAHELGDNCTFLKLDVTIEEDWQAATEAAAQKFGPLTTLLNCAGVSIPSNIEEADFDHWRHVNSINADGVFLGCKYGVKALKASKGASIINISSTFGKKGGSLFPAYCASKGAVRQLTKSVALHCAERGYDIRCNSILPGAIHTEMFEGYIKSGIEAGATREQVIKGFGSAQPMGRLGQPGEIADACIFLASDEASFITGIDLPVDGGFCA